MEQSGRDDVAIPTTGIRLLILPASDADIAIIDRTATLRGRLRVDFVCDAAEDVLMETAPIRMSEDGFRSFLKALSAPPSPVPEMFEVLKRTAPWEKRTSNARN